MTETERITRRSFLKTTALLGGSALLMSRLDWAREVASRAQRGALTHAEQYQLSQPQNILYSVCQQCNGQCGIRVKLLDGMAVKIDGNPYSPWNLVPHLDYKTPLASVATLDAPLCPRGQSGVQTLYDPYRITKVLKRAGKRGENKWITIPFEQAVDEIVNGGKLFAHVPGEENRVVEGLKDVYAVRDPKLMREMGDLVRTILAEKDVAKKRALVAQFKEKFKEHLDKMIDPDHPDLGPKNNQILYFWGRQKAGRGDFAHRFFGGGLGTVNRHGHTTVCQGSLYFAGKSMTDQWDGKGWSGGSKMYWMADTASAEFVIFVGASPFEGNYTPTNRTPRITEGLQKGRLKIAVIDPRYSKTASKAWKWLPNRPGTEGAIALGLIRWVIENRRFDVKYLSNANRAAALADKEPTWTNACWLVKIENNKPTRFLRASEIGLSEKELFVTLKDGQPVAFDPNDDKNAAEGDLFIDTTIRGIRVKSALQILWESASSKTLAEWARISGLSPRDLEELAREFTSHGKRAAVDLHRGVSQHTNGYYNVLAWFSLALLIGNYDWRGGQSWPSTYDILGSRADGPFNFGKLNPGALSPFGVSLIRHEVKFEETTLFEGKYPARRNWYPLASDIYQEIIPSAGDAYPYPIKIAFMYMASPVYALPAGHTWIPILQDVNKIPLLIASDIVVGETSMYADYIFPDVTYLERWEFSGTHPSVTFKVQGVRQPVVAPLTGTVKVYGEEMALQWEALLLALAEKLGLPNFGPNGLGPGQPFTHPDHFYLRMVANVAFGERADGSDAVPDASDEEIKLFLEARKHLPKSVFDPERWQAIVGEKLWRKVVTVLNRGGRFQSYAEAYAPTDTQLRVRYGRQINLYLEKTAEIKHSGTAETLPGYAVYLPTPTDYRGRLIEDEKNGFDLQLITHREILQTKSRTSGNYWLTEFMPENLVLMNSQDAQRLGLKSGDRVKIVSATNPEGVWDLGNGVKVPMAGAVQITEGIRPGVISFALGWGHWAYGAMDVVIDGNLIKKDERRGRGFHGNAAMRVDPFLKNTCLIDAVGGSAVFYDTRVKVIKL
ncbi:MAG: molybdopterin-dependent oxidoreductase [Candidatus Bipolaricaulota bacterium]|nr:molybdopterin-dependent oxidoreductase [Candidatus Bipolaricaulota bacterium]MCS7274811.1 molybdopterin-dependent oxidoreductase [Candidatus Bipolaricaulota bacterium]MDW8111232.1 molybdopterin-dependent oxidoreductase [Candidatus Bipolaricaulota bacterium]MDW8328632.1 molybdopterin-dependent oxidoreductase [Candidatus Bipolaricaulota bacterium]